MPMPFRTLRLSAGTAICAVAACAIAGKAAAQVPASLLIGPDRVGRAVTYRLTTSGDRAQSAPNVQTLALRWKLGQKVVVTLSSVGDSPFVATRATDGTLTVDNASAGEADGQRVTAAVDVLNRLDALVASAPAGAKMWNTTLATQPAQAPQPLKIPLAATRSDDATGTTLAASGSIDRTMARPATGTSPRGGGMGGGRRGGGMGGGGMGGGGMGGGGTGDSFGSSSVPKSTKVTTKITVDAHFGVDGELISGTIVESNQVAGEQTQPNPQNQPSTRSWQIDRTQ